MKELIDFMFGFLLLIALAYGLVHCCGVVTRLVGRLTSVAVSGRKSQRSGQADPASSPSA